MTNWMASISDLKVNFPIMKGRNLERDIYSPQMSKVNTQLLLILPSILLP